MGTFTNHARRSMGQRSFFSSLGFLTEFEVESLLHFSDFLLEFFGFLKIIVMELFEVDDPSHDCGIHILGIETVGLDDLPVLS